MSRSFTNLQVENFYNFIFDDPDAKRENANVNADTQNGALFLLGTEAGKALALQKLLPSDMAAAHMSGDIHIHDLAFYGLSFNCIQHDLRKLFSKVFKIDTCSIRQPQSVESTGALLAIVLQTAQGEAFGGQGVPDYDFVMAEGVLKTFRRELAAEVSRLPLSADIQEQQKQVWDAAWRNTEHRTFQASEALVHNLNSLRARAGGQLTFSNLNYGLDTSDEGRMATRCLLKAMMVGLGDGATPIFPVQIFKVKEGVNYNPEDPNYDLFQLAMECSARRMWPNFAFLDADFNKNQDVAYMGCRTRVVTNIFDPTNEVAAGRGNLFFTTVNLPRLAIKADGDIRLFWDLLNDVMDLGIRQLHHRFNVLAHKKARNFPFLFGENIWLGSERLEDDDEIGDVWKHGSLSLGFIGLAETLTALTGKHHGESDAVQELGLEIVQHMRKRLDFESEHERMNFTLLATPAEGLCLAGDTLVQTPHGSRPIINIKAGDRVFSRNEEGFIEIDEVVRAWQTSPSRKVVRVTFDTRQEIVCTPNHPFGVQSSWSPWLQKNVIWINACDLKEGTRVFSHYLRSSAGQHHIVKKVEWLDKEIPVYDITVKKNSNFFVGDNRGILVHNSGRFVKLDQARYGKIPGVTDKEYYTNSFHIPVEFTISAFDKIALEAPYHELTNAGHITYVELDGDPGKNLEAFKSIVCAMHDAGVGYGAVNHPLDFDPVCGFSGVIDNECPGCGRKADEKVQRVRRLTGYLAPVNRWNKGKLAELKDRESHFKGNYI